MRTEATQQQRTYSLVCVISSCVSLLPRQTSCVQCPLIFKCFHSLLHHPPPHLLNVPVFKHSSAWSLLPSLWLLSLSLHCVLSSLCMPSSFLFLPSLPASLPPAAGGRFRRPGGDDLTVDGAQQQHEPDGSKDFGGRYPMRLRDGHVQDCSCHCDTETHYRQRYTRRNELTALRSVFKPALEKWTHKHTYNHWTIWNTKWKFKRDPNQLYVWSGVCPTAQWQMKSNIWMLQGQMFSSECKWFHQLIKTTLDGTLMLLCACWCVAKQPIRRQGLMFVHLWTLCSLTFFFFFYFSLWCNTTAKAEV